MEVKEAYCSFEVAKLLKEKGFDESIRCWYDNFQDFHEEGARMSNTDCLPPTIMCPTHQMACAWVRKKGYSVEVHATAVGWHWEVCKVNGTSIAFDDIVRAFDDNVSSDNTNDGGAFDDYDECMESALMYTLTNLI